MSQPDFLSLLILYHCLNGCGGTVTRNKRPWIFGPTCSLCLYVFGLLRLILCFPCLFIFLYISLVFQLNNISLHTHTHTHTYFIVLLFVDKHQTGSIRVKYIDMHVSLQQDMEFFRYMPRRGIDGSYVRLTFSFISIFHIILHSYQQ